MGFDISYHPIKETEITAWYFNQFEDLVDKNYQQANQLAEDFGIEDFYRQKYIDTLTIGVDTEPAAVFDESHGYYIAVIQGFFRPYFYIRGGAFSFLLDKHPVYEAYTQHWQDLLPYTFDNPIKNRIRNNYSSGVYIPYPKLEQLYQDYHKDPKVREELDTFFSEGRLAIFLQAIRYCREHQLGLLEATEVVEPNPLDLNASPCYSNLFHCDLDGPMLYRDTALAQISAIEQQQKLAPGTISDKATYEKTVIPPPPVPSPKKGFWKKLFGGT